MKHLKYNKDCKICQRYADEASYICNNFGRFEGYDNNDEKDWAEIVDYIDRIEVIESYGGDEEAEAL